MPAPNFDLYLITDRKLARGGDLCAVVAQALDGGVKAIQLREKDLGGKALFDLAEKIAALCQRHNAWAITDEIYEHIRYTGGHIPMAALPGMADRTITISGAWKTYSIPGWRTGGDLTPTAAGGACPEGA